MSGHASEALVTTARADRYLTQLCQHLTEMGDTHRGPLQHLGHARTQLTDVTRGDATGTVRFVHGMLSIAAHDDALRHRLDADDDASLRELERGIASRISTIGRRDALEVQWQRLDR